MINLLFPPACLYCNALLEEKTHFCKECLENFTLIPVEGRCQKCSAEIPLISGTCKPCRSLSHPFRRFGACFDAHGPALSLLKAYSHGHFRLAKEIASYLVVQLDRLNFPPFDQITILPKKPLLLIGRELSKLLNSPLKLTLKKHLALDPTFSLKKKCNIINQNVLLLDDFSKDLNGIRAAGFTLQQGWPQTLYGMIFCAY